MEVKGEFTFKCENYLHVLGAKVKPSRIVDTSKQDMLKRNHLSPSSLYQESTNIEIMIKYASQKVVQNFQKLGIKKTIN
jgi:hypothetical protein